MSASLTPNEIIASALRLPSSDREQLLDALHESLIDRAIDHGPMDPPDEVRAAWTSEIAHRIEDLATDRVKTIPAEEAERMIRGESDPEI